MKSVLLSLLIALSFYAQAAVAKGSYADVSVQRYKVQLQSGIARPYVARLKLGYEVTDTVAVELVHGEPLDNDNLANQSFDIESMNGYFLRYQSEYHNNVRIFVFGGKSKFETTQIVGEKNQFDDTGWGIGAEEMIPGKAHMYYVLEYAQFIKKDGDQITGITFGFRWDL